MSRIRLFTLPNCPKCPAAKALVETLKQRRADVTVEVIDMSDSDNYATALMLQVFVTPTIVIGETPTFIGEVPSLGELNRRIDEYEHKQDATRA